MINEVQATNTEPNIEHVLKPFTTNPNYYIESNNNDRESLHNGKKTDKTHDRNDAGNANTFSNNITSSQEQTSHSTSHGIVNNNQTNDSNGVTVREKKVIGLAKTDIQSVQDDTEVDIPEGSSLMDHGSHNYGQECRQVVEAGSTRRHRSEQKMSTEEDNEDSSDEDVGFYAESFRCSNWVCVDQKGDLQLKMEALPSTGSSESSASVSRKSTNDGSSTDVPTDGELCYTPTANDVFSDSLSQPVFFAGEREQSDSTTPTASEFKHRYMSRRKCLIQRANSQKEYHRLSARIYDQDRQVVINRLPSGEDLGLHLLDSYPAYITSVDPGSAAERAGATEGQILVSVNGHNVLTTNHADIVKLIHSLKGSLTLEVACSDFQPVRDLQATVMSGHMLKLGNYALKIWKRRFFILRQDNCLYYYKSDQESNPLGAFPLGGYTISRHTETGKKFCFRAEKIGGRTYYFCADNRDQMTAWVGALSKTSICSMRRKDSFLSVSSHNIGLPAMHIPSPECAGFLSKLNPSGYAWRRRYCVLKDACVYYYQDKSSLSALGVIHLHGYTANTENYQRKKYSFCLRPPEQKMMVFAFCADNETDKTRWVELVISSIQRWVPADQDVGFV